MGCTESDCEWPSYLIPTYTVSHCQTHQLFFQHVPIPMTEINCPKLCCNTRYCPLVLARYTSSWALRQALAKRTQWTTSLQISIHLNGRKRIQAQLMSWLVELRPLAKSQTTLTTRQTPIFFYRNNVSASIYALSIQEEQWKISRSAEARTLG